MKDRIVYSTDPNYPAEEEKDIIEVIEPGNQNLRIWLEKRPGNKVVSIIRGYIGTESELKDLSKVVKKCCGVGGSVKAGEIIVQTRNRQKLLQILNDLGYFAKFSGG